MKTAMDYLLICITVAYIVDVSGFTQSWKGLLWRLWKIRTDSLKPFDCSACLTFWACLIYAIAAGRFTLLSIAMAAVASALALPAGQAIILTREALCALIRKLLNRL